MACLNHIYPKFETMSCAAYVPPIAICSSATISTTMVPGDLDFIHGSLATDYLPLRISTSTACVQVTALVSLNQTSTQQTLLPVDGTLLVAVRRAGTGSGGSIPSIQQYTARFTVPASVANVNATAQVLVDLSPGSYAIYAAVALESSESTNPVQVDGRVNVLSVREDEA